MEELFSEDEIDHKIIRHAGESIETLDEHLVHDIDELYRRDVILFNWDENEEPDGGRYRRFRPSRDTDINVRDPDYATYDHHVELDATFDLSDSTTPEIIDAWAIVPPNYQSRPYYAGSIDPIKIEKIGTITATMNVEVGIDPFSLYLR